MRRTAKLALAATALGLMLSAAALLFLDRRFPPPLEALRRPPAVAVLDNHGRPLRLFLPDDESWRLPVTLDELPPELPAAVLATEDARFYRHPGVDPLAILRATWQNLRAGRVVSGGSTLPMQLARLAEPAPRTLSAKLSEAVRAVQLERRFSKRELLELYLNLAPYGGNLEGVGAASRFYFGKQPAQLSPGEMALLVALPRSPTAYDPTRNPVAARDARDRVLARLEAAGVFDSRQVEAARRQPVPRRRQPTPFEAPHFTRWAAAHSPGEARVETTLDRSAQQIAEAQVARHVPALRRQGIAQAAVVVVETDGRRLRASVGSAGFLEAGRAGQVDGTVARRSPGSTLKPFLYALAVDSGEVVPDAFLLDVPTDFSGYVAKNYDGRYNGRVTVREALRRSLNAPAVRLLSRVGLQPFYKLLVSGGISTLDRPAGRYGLPLVLGAGEVSLLELTNLYASIADRGRYQPLAWRDGPPTVAAEPLVSPETAWLITEILRQVERPDLPAAWRLARDVPAVAWKTGTSYGHRDAWAVGYSGKYTIGVWVGNFDGAARQGISGSEHAAPLLFDLFRALEPGGAPTGRPAGLRIESLEVCALSHQLPGSWCPTRARIEYLPGRSRLTRCDHHRRVRVAGGAGSSAFREVTRYPSELVGWWRAEGHPLPDESIRFTRWAAGDNLTAGDPPRIVSPDAATPYHLRRGAPREHQRIALIAQAGVDVERLYWYRDGLLVASGMPGERLFLDPFPGDHRLVVTDDRGRQDALSYRVE